MRNEESVDEDRGALLLTADAVAKLLAISKRSLWRLVSTGRILRPIRIGKMVRWNVEELKQWIARKCPIENDSKRG